MSSTKTIYETVVIGNGNHASLEIPDKNLQEIAANKRAPLKITINGYTYQSTATSVGGTRMVVFPIRDRLAAGAKADDVVTVTLELDDGYRHVDVPDSLGKALDKNELSEKFHNLTYSIRKSCARSVNEAKAETTRARRIEKIIVSLKHM